VVPGHQEVLADLRQVGAKRSFAGIKRRSQMEFGNEERGSLPVAYGDPGNK